MSLTTRTVTKKVIVNDPIYGFITIPSGIIDKLISHPWFQRLRRIKQLGLTHLVYPGAYHTRFQHALGAMHLMEQAIEVLRSKNHKITEDEALGVRIAILLHDIGHGPFSHVLEHSIVKNVNHEYLSNLFMERINRQFNGKLELAIKIFENKYHKKFLHQLVSSQLDMDRLDYLKRDSFFTGVAEGAISSDRIIKTLNISNDQLVIDAKGIYSVENFLTARRFMYWQVYLHKTVIAAEFLLIKILQRAKELILRGESEFCTPALHFFLGNPFNLNTFKTDPKILETFAELDDYDIFSSVKVWTKSDDPILSKLCNCLINRNLYKIEMQKAPFPKKYISEITSKTLKKYKLDKKEAPYFVFTGSIVNSVYYPGEDKINILFKNGDLLDVTLAGDRLNIYLLSKPVKKYFLCYPKNCVI